MSYFGIIRAIKALLTRSPHTERRLRWGRTLRSRTPYRASAGRRERLVGAFSCAARAAPILLCSLNRRGCR
jgi:hypothetical protein